MNMNQVTLACTDIQASKNFYLTLGFTLIVDTPHYLRFACPDGGATLSLNAAQRASTGVSAGENRLNPPWRVSQLS